MIQRTLLIILTILICFPSERAFAQQAIISSGGNSTDGSINYSFGQFAYQTYFESSSSVAQGVQHPFEISFVPSLFSLTNTLIYSTETFCYNALQDITVGGEEPSVLIQTDATVNFIAGHSIRLLPGFNAQSGSSVHAYITTTNEFCDGPIGSSIVLLPAEEKSETSLSQEPITDEATTEKQVIVYPNPNHGKFNITLINIDSSVTVSIYNLSGSVYHKTDLDQFTTKEISLSNVPKGIYFVKVTSNKEQFVKKIIIK